MALSVISANALFPAEGQSVTSHWVSMLPAHGWKYSSSSSSSHWAASLARRASATASDTPGLRLGWAVSQSAFHKGSTVTPASGQITTTPSKLRVHVNQEQFKLPHKCQQLFVFQTHGVSRTLHHQYPLLRLTRDVTCISNVMLYSCLWLLPQDKMAHLPTEVQLSGAQKLVTSLQKSPPTLQQATNKHVLWKLFTPETQTSCFL